MVVHTMNACRYTSTPLNERHRLWRSWVYLYQVLCFLRQVRHLHTQRLAYFPGSFCGNDDQKHALCDDKGRPGRHALSDHHTASQIRQAAIVQRLTDLHQPVAIPAVPFVTPGLPGSIEAHPTGTRVTWTAMLTQESSR